LTHLKGEDNSRNIYNVKEYAKKLKGNMAREF
jgi:hypothetical protein